MDYLHGYNLEKLKNQDINEGSTFHDENEIFGKKGKNT